MAAIHRRKIWPEYFEDVKSGRKTFEIRNDDRPGETFEVGDTLILDEFDPKTGRYTWQSVACTITYVLEIGGTRFGANTVVLGIQVVPPASSPSVLVRARDVADDRLEATVMVNASQCGKVGLMMAELEEELERMFPGQVDHGSFAEVRKFLDQDVDPSGPVPDYTGEGSAWVPPKEQTPEEWANKPITFHPRKGSFKVPSDGIVQACQGEYNFEFADLEDLNYTDLQYLFNSATPDGFERTVIERRGQIVRVLQKRTGGVKVGERQIFPPIPAPDHRLFHWGEKPEVVHGDIPVSEAHHWALCENGSVVYLEPGKPGPEGRSWTLACAAQILKDRATEKEAKYRHAANVPLPNVPLHPAIGQFAPTTNETSES